MTESADDAPMVGDHRIIAELGSGGMATVYLAVTHRRPQPVVVKVPHDAIFDAPELLALFYEEGRAGTDLDHPNVVRTLEVLEEALVLEYVEGHTLSEVLSRCRRVGRRLPLGMHLRIIVEALRGLHYVHERAIVHRDVSPHNVLVGFDGRVKLFDFGIAHNTHKPRTFDCDLLKGKIRYMAPEHFRRAPIIDHRSDVFSVGALLWQAATGEKLWKNVSDHDVISCVKNDGIPMPDDVRADADPELTAIVRRAMAYDPADRHQDCVELTADVENVIARVDPNCAPSDVGRFVSDLFADARMHRQTVIERHLHAR